MHTLYVRNLPDDLYSKIRQLAARRRRSMGAEVIVLIEQALQQEAALEKQMEALDRIAERRASYKAPADSTDSLTLLREDRSR